MNHLFKVQYFNYYIDIYCDIKDARLYKKISQIISKFASNDNQSNTTFYEMYDINNQSGTYNSYENNSYENNGILKACITDNPAISLNDNYTYFLCLNENVIPDNLNFRFTILIGSDAIEAYNIFPVILHNYNLPDYLFEDKINNMIIREYNIADFDNVYREFHTEQSYIDEYMTLSYDEEKIIFENYIKCYSLFETGYYGLWINNNLAGQYGITYHETNLQDNSFNYELSYYINEKYQNNGLSYKFLKIIIDNFYLHHDEEEIIYCKISEDNIASYNIACKLNFKFEFKLLETKEIIMSYKKRTN